MTSSSWWRSYEISASTLTMSSRWSNTSVVLSAVASFSCSDCVALLVKKSPSVWSRHSSSAEYTNRPSRVDHQTVCVATCTERLCSSRHWHQAKGSHHSSSDALTLAADKIANFVYKLCHLMHLIHTNQRPAYMAEMVELTVTSSSRSGFRSASHLLYQKPALKTMQVRWTSLQLCRPCCLEQSARLYSVWVKH